MRSSSLSALISAAGEVSARVYRRLEETWMRTVAARRLRRDPPPSRAGDPPTTTADRGAVARQLFEDGRYAESEAMLWDILRTSPAAPATTYLLGLAVLRRGRVSEARRLIERAYRLQPWIDDRVSGPDASELLLLAQKSEPDWSWPTYQLRREQWRAVDLSLRTATQALVRQRDEPPTFVQVGANDGIRGDPLKDLIATFGLRGLFVEPQAEPFAKLRERYAHEDGFSFANVAVTDEDGPVTMTTASSRTTLGTIVPSRNLMRHRREDSVEVQVDGRTFSSLMTEHALGNVEILQIDTEGFDYHILRQVPLLDLGVQIVNMEFFCLPIDERLLTLDLLEEAGFAWFVDTMDLLGVRRDAFEDEFCITSMR